MDKFIAKFLKGLDIYSLEKGINSKRLRPSTSTITRLQAVEVIKKSKCLRRK